MRRRRLIPGATTPLWLVQAHGWRRTAPRWLAAIMVAGLAVQGYRSGAHAARPATLPPPSTIRLTPSLPSPRPLGTPITWTASATDTLPLVYRFSVASAASGPYRIARDFSPRAGFTWTPLQEGRYYVAVTVKEGYSATVTASNAISYTLTARASGTTAAVSRTVNPLVALYSAPACSSGYVLVKFQPVGAQAWTSTNAQPCQGSLSRNFLVAGMYPKMTYQMVHVNISAGSVMTSTPLLFTTGTPPAALPFPTISVPQPAGPGSNTAAHLLFHALLDSNSVNPLATDLQGHVVWYDYQPDLTKVLGMRLQQVGGPSGSTVAVLGNDGQQPLGDDVLRIIDLAGDPLQETNVQAVNQQLAARGQEIIYGFSHDALFLPNGDVATLGYTQQTITTTAVMGDMLLVLDKNLQVVWTWDAFQHLDPNRGPTLGDTCALIQPDYCPVPGRPNAIDWTHSNAIDYTPADGNLILSVRNQDWVIKINYANGTGDGAVLWRLGPQGDFSLVPLDPADPYPWFSHQHDANFVDGGTLAVFDNGNTRCASAPSPCDSRGQAYAIDEGTRTVTQTLSADLGNYSTFLGTAQRLSNGNYNFTLGTVMFPPPLYSQDVEVLPSGAITYIQQLQGNSPAEYRAWRLTSLYAPINPACPVCPSVQ